MNLILKGHLSIFKQKLEDIQEYRENLIGSIEGLFTNNVVESIVFPKDVEVVMIGTKSVPVRIDKVLYDWEENEAYVVDNKGIAYGWDWISNDELVKIAEAIIKFYKDESEIPFPVQE